MTGISASTHRGHGVEEPPERLITPMFVLITASAFAYFLSVGSLLPVLPRYVEDTLGGGGLEVGVVVGAFAVSAALVRPTIGRLGDVFGRRAMAIAGGAIAAVSIIPLGLVPAVWFLVLLRLANGLGEAAYFVGSATAVQDLASDERRGEAASFFSIALYGGLAFGPVVGEYLYNNQGPTSSWVFAAGGALVSTVLAWFMPKELGRVEDPPPRRGLLHPAAVVPGVVILLGLTAFAGFAAFVPLYVDEVGLDDASPFFLAYGIVVLTVRGLGARLPDRLGAVRASSLGLGAVALGITTVAVLGTVVGLWVGTVLLALGVSMLFPALMSVAVNNAPDDERSHAVGSFSLFFDLAQGLGAPLLGLVVTITGAERPAFFVAGLIAASGLVVVNTKLRAEIAQSPHYQAVTDG